MNINIKSKFDSMNTLKYLLLNDCLFIIMILMTMTNAMIDAIIIDKLITLYVKYAKNTFQIYRSSSISTILFQDLQSFMELASCIKISTWNL